MVFRKTHDLYELADQLSKAGIDPPSSADELAETTPFAVEFRDGDEVIKALDPTEVDVLSTRIVTWAISTVVTKQP